jgi:hypothetical protein
VFVSLRTLHSSFHSEQEKSTNHSWIPNVVGTLIVRKIACLDNISTSNRVMNQLSDTWKLRLVLSKIIACLAVVVWFGFAGLFEHYSRTRPAVPNLDEGRTYEENQHGSCF